MLAATALPSLKLAGDDMIAEAPGRADPVEREVATTAGVAGDRRKRGCLITSLRAAVGLRQTSLAAADSHRGHGCRRSDSRGPDGRHHRGVARELNWSGHRASQYRDLDITA